jgi:hypothetical protein
MMLVPLQLVGVAVVPLNFTVLVPCVPPKFVPAIVTADPATPVGGVTVVMLGALVVTVKLTPLLATPPTVTTTFPLVAPTGTGTMMLVPLQLVGVAVVPLNFTVLVPCVPPKFVPAIVTGDPKAPDSGPMVRMLGPCGDPPLSLDDADAHPPRKPEAATRRDKIFRRLRKVVLS